MLYSSCFGLMVPMLLLIILTGINISFNLSSMVLEAFGSFDDDVTYVEEKDGDKDEDEPQITSQNNDKKLAIITFDDGKKGQIMNAKPTLDQYNFDATFSIICNNVSKSDHLNWDDIQQLSNDGYDIASHSMSHTELEDISMEVAEYEIRESKECILDNGINEVEVFTYPKNGGSDDPLILEEVSKQYTMARTGNDPLAFVDCKLTNLQNTTDKITCQSLEDDEKFDRYSLVGWSHDADREEQGYNDEQMLERFVEVVESQGKYNQGVEINAIPIIIYHEIDTQSGFYTTSTELFEAEMKYLKDNNFIIVRLLDLV